MTKNFCFCFVEHVIDHVALFLLIGAHVLFVGCKLRILLDCYYNNKNSEETRLDCLRSTLRVNLTASALLIV